MTGLDAPVDTACTTPPTISGHAYSQTNPTGTITYCGNVNISNNDELDLDPGIYIFKTGGSSCGLSVAGHGAIHGTGVFLYFEGACSVSFSGGADVQLSAPTSGTYQGVLMMQDRSNTSPPASSLTGGASQIMQGVLYFPYGLLHYTGGTTTTSSSQSATIVAYNLAIDGNSYIQSAGSSPYLSVFSGFAFVE
jgi:hypothetical protein